MIGALFYLQTRGWINKLRLRLRRLRRPRYAVSAAVGVIYFGAMFARPFWMLGREQGSLLIPGGYGDLWEFGASLALALVVILTWVIPHGRAALSFSEAEIAFLFPAPVTRRTLIHFKLIKSQTAILFTVLFLAVFSPRGGGAAGAARRALGWWLLLSTLNLHLLGASFARTLLLEQGLSTWRRRAWILGSLAAAGGAAALWIRHGVPWRAPAGDPASIEAIVAQLRLVAASPPVRFLLAPCRWVVRPFLAPDGAAFLRALGPAAALLALHYAWVARADVAFEEASLELARRHAAQAAAVRTRGWAGARPHRRSRAPFRLAPTGAPAVALLWKNLISAGYLFRARVWIWLVLWAFFAASTFDHGGGGWARLAGAAAAMLAGWSVVIGPHIFRQDFRQDLALADLLKMYPVRGWQVALGELLAPAAVLTALQWLLLLVAGTLHMGRARGGANVAIAAAIVAPMLNLVSLFIPNAAALLFPGWFAFGPAGPRGIEAAGQRLVFALGQAAAVFAAVMPAALVFWLAYLLAAASPMRPIALPVASVPAAALLAAEAALGLLALGRWFEQYDVSAEGEIRS